MYAGQQQVGSCSTISGMQVVLEARLWHLGAVAHLEQAITDSYRDSHRLHCLQSSMDFSQTAEGLVRVTVKEGEALLIPSAWPHTVLTTADTLMAGGHFLHALAIRCSSCMPAA